MSFLVVQNLTHSYGVIEAVKDISFEVQQSEIVSIIGANGAGKTSLMGTLSGLLIPTSGEIFFEDQDFTQMPPYKRVHRGISLVPEGRRVFPKLSVRENLILGAFLEKDNKKISKLLDENFSLFPILKERCNQAAGLLSGGEQQMLAIARGLMSDPKLLLLDEPSMGVAPLIVEKIFSTLQQLNIQKNLTILLVEQNAKKALSLCHRALVLDQGKVVLSGTGSELLLDKRVQEAYLGV